MVRTIFLILLLLNLVALAWIYAKGDEKINVGREPQRTRAELAAERIRLISAVEIPSSTPTAVPTTAAAPSETCRAYSGATVTEAQQIAQTLATKLPSARIAANPIVLPSAFDMVITGFVSRASAEAKLAELQRLGIKDNVQIKADDDKHFSLLIASFTERGIAENAMKTIVKKGVVSAMLVERKPVAEKATIEIRGNESALKKLPEQIAAFKSLSPVACPAP